MSKLEEKYLFYKKENNEKVYLFESGLFYLFLGEDANKFGDFFDFKITPINSRINKCGFPKKSAKKYLSILNKLGYNVEVVNKEIGDYEKRTDLIISKLKNIDVNNINGIEALNILAEMRNLL